MKRIRTIKAAHQEILAADPHSCITERMIRRAAVEGAIPTRRIGTGRQAKYMLDLDELLAYFGGESNG